MVTFVSFATLVVSVLSFACIDMAVYHCSFLKGLKHVGGFDQGGSRFFIYLNIFFAIFWAFIVDYRLKKKEKSTPSKSGDQNS